MAALPYIVAEVAQGFEGNSRLVELFCNAFLKSSADAIKFQIFYADELATPDYQHYKLFKQLELPESVWQNAVKKIHGAEKEIFSDVFGFQSLKMLNDIGFDGFKIHSTDADNLSLLRKVAETKKKVLFSTGGTDLEVVDRALEILSSNSVTLLHGFQAEPTNVGDNNLLRMQTLLKRYGKPVGFQDHTAGDLSLARSLPFIAMGIGATVIEKHFTLSRAAEIEDYVSALTAEEFITWAQEVKEGATSLGSADWKLTEVELKYKRNVKRALCASRDLKPGEKIGLGDFQLRRSGNQRALYDVDTVIGKTLCAEIKEGLAFERDFFE